MPRVNTSEMTDAELRQYRSRLYVDWVSSLTRQARKFAAWADGDPKAHKALVAYLGDTLDEVKGYLDGSIPTTQTATKKTPKLF